MESPAGTSSTRLPPLGLVGLFLVTCVFYAWTASPYHGIKDWGTGREYYNLLADGLRQGRLGLSVDPPKELVALKDPYDPALNTPYRLHDVSYYKGRYYLYFGITPALTFYLPARLLTGHYVSDQQATVAFCCAGLAAGLWILSRTRTRYFPTVPDWQLGACGLAFGTCSMLPSFLSRIAVWEVPIAAAFCFFMVSAAFLLASQGSRRPLPWLAAASLAYGLTVGARPTYVFGALLLLIPLLDRWTGPSDPSTAGARPGLAAKAAALFLPIGVIGLGLLAYNYARFGRVTEFGMHYQLTGGNESKAVLFSPAYVWYNVRVYLLEPCRLSVYFPFVKVISAPVQPAGYISVEDPYGVVPNIPFCLLIVGLVALPKAGDGLRLFVGALGLGFACTLATILLFAAAANRYMIDFLPAWILLACIGFLALLESLGPIGRRWVCLLGVLALAMSSAFNVLAGWTHNELFKRNFHRSYAPIAHGLNRPSRWLRAAYGTRQGPIDLTVMLPRDKGGTLEPLLVSGVSFMSDYVYLYYASATTLVVGLEHTSYGGPATERIPLDYTKPHTITVEVGFLYPPLEDPYFDSWPPAEAAALKRRVRIAIDGVTYLLDHFETYDPYRFHPLVGRSDGERKAFGLRFTGTIVDKRYVQAAPEPSTRVSAGALSLSLRLPPFSGRHSEPLLCSGQTGKADLIYVNYLDPAHISIGHDHWGIGGSTTPPVEIDPSRHHSIEISAGFLYPANARPPQVPAERWTALGHRLTLQVDGRSVLDIPQDFYPSTLADVRIGLNFVGASTSVERFSGTLLEQRSRVDPAN